VSSHSISGPEFSTASKTLILEKALSGAGIGVIQQDDTLGIRYVENLPAHFAASSATLGRDDAALFGEVDGVRLGAIKQQVLRNGEPAVTEVESTTSEGVRIYELKIERILEDGRFGLLSVVSDVTDTRHRERVLKSLLRELSHRSKNLLAIIQGIAMQTARNTISLDFFLKKFRGRLQSLSHSQDLITDSSWRGAYLFELAEKQFAPYWPDRASPLRVQGVNAHLSPNAAVHIGLALHELIVNSAAHGAIASGASSISLECREIETEGRVAIQIVWSELLGLSRSGSEFEEKSFGRTVLERVVPTSVAGSASFQMTPHSIEYSLTVPEAEFEILTRSA